MKRIYFVTDSLFSGGAERVMSVLANELTAFYDITIVSKAHIKPFFQIKNSIKLIYPQTVVNYQNILTILWGRLKLYIDLFIILKNGKPDVVITFCSRTNGVVIPMAKILRLKVIASEHSNYKTNSKNLSISFIKRWIYPLTNILTVLTDRDINEYYGKYLKNVVTMPNPLSLIPVKTINTKRKSNSILAVGEVSRWKTKGFDNLITIFSGIAQNYPDWILEIAGTGDTSYLNDLILKLDLTERVILLGEVRDIESLMQGAKIFVLSSRWEGLPMVLIEAMSQGLPCIAFDCFTGPAEIITNNVDGILVENQNLDEFSSKLSSLIESPALRLKLGNNAIDACMRYDPHVIVSKWQTIIDN